jgi:hypothetical protein
MTSTMRFDKWENSLGQPFGTILQVASTTISPPSTTTTSTSYQNSGLGLSINLKNLNSKVLVLVSGGHGYVATFANGLIETICRQDSTVYDSSKDLANTTYGLSQIYNSTNLNTSPHSMSILDTPGIINPTYRVFFRSRTGGTVWWQEGSSFITMTLLEIAQ